MSPSAQQFYNLEIDLTSGSFITGAKQLYNIEKAIETIAKTKLTPIQPLTKEVDVLNLLV
jgi:hypothetical protein